jgi:hypothetical protein
LLASAGDLIIFEVGKATPVQVGCPIYGVLNGTACFNPWPLYLETNGAVDEYTVELVGVYRFKSMAVDDTVQSIPRLQEIILDPPVEGVLNHGVNYSVEDVGDVRGIVFEDGLYSAEKLPPKILWAEVTFLDNKKLIADNFGDAVGLSLETFSQRTDNLDYLAAVSGVWYSFMGGPTLYRVRTGIHILLGLPFAEVAGTIEEINYTFNLEKSRILLRERDNPNLVRVYYVPRNLFWEGDGESIIAINPETGVEYAAGDTVERFAPLSKGLTVIDDISNPNWWISFFNQLGINEVEKFVRFFIQADADLINPSNFIFAMEFVQKIKPGITKPFWNLLKRVEPDYISVTDNVENTPILHLYDDPATMGANGKGGSFRYDDVDGAGEANWVSDGPIGDKAALAFDNRRLYPTDEVSLSMFAYHPGGYFTSDWVAAFDGGGGTDVVPLSGPIPALPGPPYGPVISLSFDTTYPAGYYARIKSSI